MKRQNLDLRLETTDSDSSESAEEAPSEENEYAGPTRRHIDTEIRRTREELFADEPHELNGFGD